MKGSRWNRWTTVITEPSAVHLCTPDVIIIPPEDSFDSWHSVLQTYCGGASQVLVCVSSEWNTTARARGFTYDRMFSRDELYDMFPYLGEPIKDTDSIEKCVVAFAHILRIRRIVWSSGSDTREHMDFGTAAMYDAWKKTLDGSLTHISADSDDTIIPRMWLIQQYYKPPNSRRTREIQHCLQKNLECPMIDHVLLLNESEYTDLPAHSKLQTSILSRRLTYSDVMKTICERVPAGDYVVFANSDIYFDTSLQYCWRVGMAEKSICMALLRWEESTGELFGPRADSQDAWIVARDTVARMTLTEDDFGFPFGKSGCDNALALVMMQRRCLVVNPAHSIKSWHVHASNYRTYDPKDILYRTHYLYLDPTFIQTYDVVRDMGAAKYAPPKEIANVYTNTYSKSRSFPRRILGIDDNGIKTICSMLYRQSEGTLNFSPHSANMWTEPDSLQKPPLYHIQGGAFMTYNGLINTWNELLVGKHEEWARGWTNAQQSNIMSSIHVPNLIALNLTEGSLHSLPLWCLLYLSRALAIRNIVHIGSDSEIDPPEFLVPSIPGINEFLHDCKWGTTSRITVVPVLENMNYYSEHIWAVPPSASGDDSNHILQIRQEDIAILRSIMPAIPKREKGALPVAVFCVENKETALFNRHWCEQVAECVLQKKWNVVYVDQDTSISERRIAFGRASWIFGCGSALEWMWYAAPGTTIMDFMSDSHPYGTNIHLAGASGLRYIVGVVKNEPIEYQRQHALEDIHKALQTYGFKELLSVRRATSNIDIPRILLPSGNALNGMWAHSGDTFREMVEIWAERGYVTIERNETSGYCWWGGIGEILLYDRPTHRWWNEKQPYQLALFGNCAPPTPTNGRQSVWGFWPRSPRSIEVVNMLGLNMLPYESRIIKSIFLGKVENGVQHAHRTGADWKAAVELFSMPIDPTGAPYPFTQEQYLEKLCNARFGLCLPGYGPKCNREIEYFACGVVPIVTPGVDMKGYLVPPIEGIHYFTAHTPEEVRTIVEKTKPEQWLRMSVAGRKWWNICASAEGLFRLTWERIEQCQPFLTSGCIPKHLVPQF
jgi:hypothetical protein